jgi:hypothetical protein
MFRGMSGYKNDEVKEGRRKLNNEELHNSYTSPIPLG